MGRDMENIDQRVSNIELRNARVDVDKEWETSRTRKVLLSVCTYLAIGMYLWAIHVQRPWINAIVPTVGFLISTLTMPFFKKLWLRWRRLL